MNPQICRTKKRLCYAREMALKGVDAKDCGFEVSFEFLGALVEGSIRGSEGCAFLLEVSDGFSLGC